VDDSDSDSSEELRQPLLDTDAVSSSLYTENRQQVLFDFDVIILFHCFRVCLIVSS